MPLDLSNDGLRLERQLDQSTRRKIQVIEIADSITAKWYVHMHAIIAIIDLGESNTATTLLGSHAE